MNTLSLYFFFFIQYKNLHSRCVILVVTQLKPPNELIAFIYGYDENGRWNYSVAKEKLSLLQPEQIRNTPKRKRKKSDGPEQNQITPKRKRNRSDGPEKNQITPKT